MRVCRDDDDAVSRGDCRLVLLPYRAVLAELVDKLELGRAVVDEEVVVDACVARDAVLLLGLAVVVAEEARVRPVANEDDLAQLADVEREERALVLEENHAAGGSLVGERAVFLGLDGVRERVLLAAPRDLLDGIELAEPEAREDAAVNVEVDLALVQYPGGDGAARVGGVDVAVAVHVASRHERERHRAGLRHDAVGIDVVGERLAVRHAVVLRLHRVPVGLPLLLALEVVDRAAVGDHESGEAEGVPEKRRQQERVAGGRRVVDGVVRAHERRNVRALHDVAVDARVVVADVRLACVGRRRAALVLVVVERVVLDRRDRLEVLRVVALHAFDERARKHAGDVRILAPRLVCAAPEGMAREVDRRTPVGEPAPAPALRDRLRMPAALVRDRIRDAADEILVPRHGERKRHREARALGSSVLDPVQRLVPEVVSRDAETRHRLCRASQLVALLVKRHSRDEVRGALLEGERCVKVGRLRGSETN